MTTVTVSPRFQIVIPQVIRDALGIRPGQRMHAMQRQDHIELIPLKLRRKEPRPAAMSAQDSSYVPKTELGRKLLELRNKAIRAGVGLLSAGEINEEVARRRGKSA